MAWAPGEEQGREGGSPRSLRHPGPDSLPSGAAQRIFRSGRKDKAGWVGSCKGAPRPAALVRPQRAQQSRWGLNPRRVGEKRWLPGTRAAEHDCYPARQPRTGCEPGDPAEGECLPPGSRWGLGALTPSSQVVWMPRKGCQNTFLGFSLLFFLPATLRLT